MLEILDSFSLGPWDWTLLIISAMLVGMSKTGVAGIYHLVIVFLAIVFEAKASTGILLPMLIMADVFAVIYYNRVAKWKYVLTLLPWAIAGVVLGTVFGNTLGNSDDFFKAVMGGIILLGIGFMIWLEVKGIGKIPNRWYIPVIVGLISGFTTMVGNAAGPVLAVYLLSMGLPKNTFIGTNAWFFMLINLIKLPFHIWAWETITPATVLLDLSLLPCIALGAWLGIRIVKLISDSQYRWFVILATAISALLLIF